MSALSGSSHPAMRIGVIDVPGHRQGASAAAAQAFRIIVARSALSRGLLMSHFFQYRRIDPYLPQIIRNDVTRHDGYKTARCDIAVGFYVKRELPAYASLYERVNAPVQPERCNNGIVKRDLHFCH